MDPFQIRIDLEVLVEVIKTIIAPAFLVERALPVFVESKLFVNSWLGDSGIKEFLAVVVSRSRHALCGV